MVGVVQPSRQLLLPLNMYIFFEFCLVQIENTLIYTQCFTNDPVEFEPPFLFPLICSTAVCFFWDATPEKENDVGLIGTAYLKAALLQSSVAFFILEFRNLRKMKNYKNLPGPVYLLIICQRCTKLTQQLLMFCFIGFLFHLEGLSGVHFFSRLQL